MQHSKYSIVPEILSSQKLEFFDEHNVKISICEETNSKFESPFKPPFLRIDSFTKDTKYPPKLKGIEIDELRKMGFALTVNLISKKDKWFSRQSVFYRLESISNLSQGSRKLNHIPQDHRIVVDIANERLRLEGKNAGRNRIGQWINLKKEENK